MNVPQIAADHRLAVDLNVRREHATDVTQQNSACDLAGQRQRFQILRGRHKQKRETHDRVHKTSVHCLNTYTDFGR